MNELIQRIGISGIIQIAVSLWSNILLVIITLSLSSGIKKSKSSAGPNNYQTPFTKEIMIFFIAVFFYNTFDIVINLITGVPGDFSVSIHYVMLIGYFALGAFQTLLFLQVVKKYVAQVNGMERLRKTTLFIQLLHIPALVLLTITPFTHLLFYLDERSDYFRGALYPIWYYTTIISFVYILLVLVLCRRKMDRFIFKVLITTSVLPIIGFILNITYTGISFNNLSVTLSALIVYVFYESYRTSTAVSREHELNRVQQELLESRLATEQANNEMLMAQIQPHFISNSLMALRAQCTEYPEIYESITNFSMYLRSHFEALSGSNKMISFEKEMENTEAYLALEQQNFGDRLNVIYHIECDDFMLPPLTVQPLVENAVRHGIGTYDEGGDVQISSRREPGSIVIEVIDNGSGKSNITQQQTERRGIGIENVRSRLRSIAGGELEVITNESGTTARITLPEPIGE